MTFIHMIFYETKNRLRFSMQMLVLAVMAVAIMFGVLPFLEQIIESQIMTTRFCVAFVNNENSGYVDMAMKEVLESPSVKSSFELLPVEEKHAVKMLENNEIAAIIIIPEGFIEGMQSGHFKEIEVWLNPNQRIYAELIKGGMESGGYLMSAVQNSLYTVYSYISELPISREEADRLFNIEMLSMIATVMNRESVFERSIKTPWQDMEAFDFYSISIILLFMTLYSVGAIYKWRENEDNKLTARMKLVCKHPAYVVWANVFAGSVMTFIQGIMIFIPLFLVRHGLEAFRILPYLYLISLNISAMVLLFGAVIKNITGAVSAFVAFGIFSAFASGTLMPFYFLPEFIPSGIKGVMPNYYWQQLLINAYSKDLSGQGRYILGVIGMTAAIFIVLRSITCEKFSDYKSVFTK